MRKGNWGVTKIFQFKQIGKWDKAIKSKNVSVEPDSHLQSKLTMINDEV